jgi:hypothetical protein
VVELSPGLGANLVEFSLQTPNFGIKFDERETLRRDQPVWAHTRVGLSRCRLDANARGRFTGPRIAIQVHKVETCGLHGGIMPRTTVKLACGFSKLLKIWRGLGEEGEILDTGLRQL